MGKETGFRMNSFSHRHDIVHGRRAIDRRQELSGGRVFVFWRIAQREQGFGTSMAVTGPGDGKHIVWCEIFPAISGRFDEGAVRALVPTHRGQRNKDFGRICDDPPLAFIAQSLCLDEEGTGINRAVEIGTGKFWVRTGMHGRHASRLAKMN